MFGYGVWLFIFGLLYFRAMETSQRNVTLWRAAKAAGSADGEAVDAAMNAPKVSLLGPRGVFLALLLGLPGLTAPLTVNEPTYHLLVTLSFGAFLSGLLPPTAAEPEPEDLRRPGTVPIKWMIAKFDQTSKVAVGLVVISVLTLIPVVGDWLEVVGKTVFAIVPGRPTSPYFADLALGGVLFNTLLHAAPVLLLFGVLLRMSILAGVPCVLATFLISVPAIFVGYQAMLELASKNGRTFPEASDSIWGAFAVDFLGCCLGLAAARVAQLMQRGLR